MICSSLLLGSGLIWPAPIWYPAHSAWTLSLG